MAADAVAEIIGTTASRPDHTCYQTRTIQDSQGRKWKVMRDSSINPIRKVGTENMDEYRVEFVTPVLKYEDLETLQAIIRKFKEIGGVRGQPVPGERYLLIHKRYPVSLL